MKANVGGGEKKLFNYIHKLNKYEKLFKDENYMAKEASIVDLGHDILNSLYHLIKQEGKYFTASEDVCTGLASPSLFLLGE